MLAFRALCFDLKAQGYKSLNLNLFFLMKLLLLGFLFFHAAFFAHAGENPTGKSVNESFLAGLRREVAANYPAVRGAGERIAAAETTVRTIRLWENPMLGLGYMTGDAELMMDEGDIGFGVEIPLPRLALVEARRSKAKAEVDLAMANRSKVELEIQRVVATSALEIALLDDLIAIERLEILWMEKMAQNALEKAKDPGASAVEVLRFESELAKQRQKLETFFRKRERIAGQLNILLGRSADISWVSLRLPGKIPYVPEAAAIRRSLESNPMVRMAKAEEGVSKRDVTIARAESGPVVAIAADSSFYSGVGYRQTTLGVQVSLPWFNEPSYRAGRETAAHALAARRQEAEGVRRNAEFEASAARTEAASAFETKRRFHEDVIPRMEEAMKSTESAWISSRASLIDVLDARRSLLMSKVEERRALAEGLAAIETLRALSPSAFNSK
jgi:outer membrane protein TolC